jgi:predicted Zn-dependent peptidase
VTQAVTAIVAELAKVRVGGVTDEEVAVAAKRLKTMIAFNSENPEFMGEYYGRQELFRERIITMDEYVTKIDKVTKEDINALIKKYFVTNNLNMALVWSRPKDEKLLTLLSL